MRGTVRGSVKPPCRGVDALGYGSLQRGVMPRVGLAWPINKRGQQGRFFPVFHREAGFGDGGAERAAYRGVFCSVFQL